MKKILYSILSLNFFLFIYGALRFPGALQTPSGFIGNFLLILIYGLVIYFWFSNLQTTNPQVFQAGARSGFLIGFIFISEMLLEYALLPSDNTQMGLIEYGSILLIILLTGGWVAYQTSRFRNGVYAALVSALIGSAIFVFALLSIFYLFHGTHQQELVFQAEGNFEDFKRSNLTDFNTFIMQDFLGAAFFHSILLPLISGIFGSIGSLFGSLPQWFGKIRKTQA